MEFLVYGRGQGKTTELIKMCAKQGGYMVVHSRNEASRVFHAAKEMGEDIPFPLTFDELLKGQYYGPGVHQVFIDNVDMLLAWISQVPVLAVSATGITRRRPVMSRPTVFRDTDAVPMDEDGE
jgi:hypothetical protein